MKTNKSTDRGFLELAAKAAGIELDWDIPENSCTPWRMTGVRGADDYGPASEWNPLTNDGDALRLAVKLGISIDPSKSSVSAISHDNKYVAIEHGPEAFIFLAARRAIVRVAAEIGGKK